ncbi:hypothetical protein OG871_40635 (plasmid) [Kitasatospora sp. NBC_00374]|uniref:hypothetical protein n=1 Tax=Kitasatospora sp. NBC_00374 TaxID=2975964 RepID=UPI002F90C9A2
MPATPPPAPFTYTGQTDPYQTGAGHFPGPHVRDADILDIEVVRIPSPAGDGAVLARPAVRLTVASTADRGPSELQVTQWGTPADWTLHPAHLPEEDRARLVAAALVADGIPAGLQLVGHGLFCAAVELNTRAGRRTLYVGMEDSLGWELVGDGPNDAQPGGDWWGAFPHDAPALVRRFVRRAKATFAGEAPPVRP